MGQNRSWRKIVLIVVAIAGGFVVIATYPAYLLTKLAFNNYFNDWGEKLVNLEKRGLLSQEYGAGWQDVLTGQEMEKIATQITKRNEDTLETFSHEEVKVVDGVELADYPSLSIIDRLREIKAYSNVIEIVDRKDRPLSTIKTDHLRAGVDEFPPVLITALLAAEDGSFRENEFGFEFDSFIRAAIQSVLESIKKLRVVSPRGTSTITQQVAKLFISDIDDQGMRSVNRSVGRKIRELRISVALRKMYSADDVLEVYCNHCVTSDYGMIGYKDIARGLFNKKLDELNDAQCIYLARMVKWGRNIPTKILRQCRIDMPRMGNALGWDSDKQAEVLAALDTIGFVKLKHFQGSGYGSLVDLANEFWFKTLRMNGLTKEQIAQMDLIDPNSLVRKKGNLRIKLSIDLPLQKELEKLVQSRGYGPDTTIISEIRIGSIGENVTRETAPKDSMGVLTTLKEPMDFKEPGSLYITSLNQGDSVIANIRYKKFGKSQYRRSCFYYVRKPTVVDGQYFAYSIMDSRTGKLRAYYSKDRIGSRLNCLLTNKTPNGSSIAKPILNALNFDLGTFKPWSKWTDTVSVYEPVAWKRELDYSSGKLIGVVFEHSAVKGRGYPVHNHNNVFEGCQYVFDLLASSNNILGVESVYRLNRSLFDQSGDIIPDAFGVVQLLYRIGAFSRIKDSLRLTSITGVRVFKELGRIVGCDIDSMMSYGRIVPVSDSMYSVALGTLEMNLYEQMHLFNMLYNNDLIERPEDHPTLAIESIILNGDTVSLNDTIRRYHPFSDINAIRPTLLGMHKRLISNRADGLSEFDIVMETDSGIGAGDILRYSDEKFYLSEPLSNFAKSGTTDDVIRPFNVDNTSKQRTNFCLWNAVVRVDLEKFAGEGDSSEIADLTVACIGEGNVKYTGERDGKTLHKFVTKGLLQKAGIPASNGYYKQYEQFIRQTTPVDECCGCVAGSSDSVAVVSDKTKWIEMQNENWFDELGD